MTDATDMSTPVTRGELRAEIDQLRVELEHRFAALVTKAEFEAKISTLMTKAEFEAKISTLVTKADLKADLENWGRALMAELARHARAIQEAVSMQISAIDDKYADLPGRVSRLETTVFTRKRR